MSLDNPPESICLVRLSSIGDITHILPIVNTIMSYLPQTKITWIIGKLELALVHDLPGVEFIAFDKSKGMRTYLDLRQRLRKRRFDVLLLMQLSLRANLIAPLVNTSVRIGFDQHRSKDLHSLFINRRIKAKSNQHVLDSFFCFTQALGIEGQRLVWNQCFSDEERSFSEQVLSGVSDKNRTLIISPCSSRRWRNWPPECYARIADYAVETYDMSVVLTGGNTQTERDYARQITAAMRTRPLNLTGKTTLRQVTAIIARADIVISPDSGPAHIATCVGKPVIGLYAASNPDRTAPYLSKQWCVNRYPEAARRYLGKDWQILRWGTKIRNSNAMDLITVADVRKKLDALAGFLTQSDIRKTQNPPAATALNATAPVVAGNGEYQPSLNRHKVGTVADARARCSNPHRKTAATLHTC